MEAATQNRPLRVLIAEDEPHIRRVVRAIVAALGGQVVGEAQDGEEAVALAAGARPDVVLLDINMPRLTGDAALEQILARAPDTIVVMMTAQDTLDAVRTCLERGARNYILKSNRAEEILAILRETWPEYVDEVRKRGAA